MKSESPAYVQMNIGCRIRGIIDSDKTRGRKNCEERFKFKLACIELPFGPVAQFFLWFVLSNEHLKRFTGLFATSAEWSMFFVSHMLYLTGSKGNLCQRKVPLAVSLALTFPAAVMAAYYLLLQTYALRLEAILNAILLFFYAVELLLGILTFASFSR